MSNYPQLLVDKEPSGAVFTDDRRHRLYLWRRWNPSLAWIMIIGLNPSKADERVNDPTIRVCMGFAHRWGFGGMFMTNAYTLVSTDPKYLNQERPLATAAHLAMRVIRGKCKEAVAAWGNQITQVRGWEERIDRIERDLAPLTCMGRTQLGHPHHPLYLPRETELVAYSR